MSVTIYAALHNNPIGLGDCAINDTKAKRVDNKSRWRAPLTNVACATAKQRDALAAQ